MVVSVIRPPRPRVGADGSRPLAQRWEEARALAERQIPENSPRRSVLSVGCTEAGIDLINDAIEAAQRERQATLNPEPNPLTLTLSNQALQLVVDVNAVALKIKGAQPWLARARGDWRHQLLKDLPADATTVPLLLDRQNFVATRFASVDEARTAVNRLHETLTWVRTIWAGIENAQRFEAMAAADQAMTLMRAYVTRKAESDARLIAIESKTAALCAQLDRLEHQLTKPKPRKVAA